MIRALELQHHLAGTITLEPFVGNGRAGDGAAQVFERLALIGTATHSGMRLLSPVREKPRALAHSPLLDGAARLGTLCKLSTFCPARGPSAMR